MTLQENAPCPFCHLPAERVVLQNEHALAIMDGYPVSPGHMLILPRRHVKSFFAVTEDERAALIALLDPARRHIEQSHTPSAYNIGINDGECAGQTVPHLHIHLIPRYPADRTDPRGGVRCVIPEKMRYWDE